MYFGGFDGFNQFGLLNNFFGELGLKENYSVDRTAGQVDSRFTGDFIRIHESVEELGYNALFSWSYCVVYKLTGSSLWFCGLLDGHCDTIKKIDTPNNLKVIQVSCNRRQVVCLVEGGGVWQYSLETGRWRDLSALFHAEVPHDELGRESAHKVCCGETLTVVLTASGSVYNLPNKLSNGGVRMTDVACGRAHAAVLSERGEIFTFGEGSRGQLGHGVLEGVEHPCLVEALSGLQVTGVACGGWHTAAVTKDGDLYTWGWNNTGQLGLLAEDGGQVSVQAVPRVVDWPAGVEVRVTRVACGTRHTVALLDDGSAWGCGWNKYRQLALPGEENVNDMTRLPLSSDPYQDVICGPWATCLFT